MCDYSFDVAIKHDAVGRVVVLVGMGFGEGKQPGPQVVGDRQNHWSDVARTQR